MAERGNPSTGEALFGLLIASIGFIGFEAILWHYLGWWVAALPVCAILTLLGYRLCWVPTDGTAGPMGGNAGTRERGTGVPYAVRIDPEDPDAGIPRRKA